MSVGGASCWTSQSEPHESYCPKYVWWPGIDGEIEAMVRGCSECQVNQKAPAAAPMPLGNGQPDHGLVSTLTKLDHFLARCF